SRRRHTRSKRDWSSDVYSSDLFLGMVECEKCKLPGKADKIYMDVIVRHMQEKDIQQVQQVAQTSWHDTYADIVSFEARDSFLQRSEERRVGKEGRSESVTH